MDAAGSINVLGFMIGVALYSLLFVMVWSHRDEKKGPDVLLLLAAVLGFVWNAGELVTFLGADVYSVVPSDLIQAFAYTCLGFLPSVVVHSSQSTEGSSRFLTISAYAVSSVAGALHFVSYFSGNPIPSVPALQMLVGASIVLIVGFYVLNFRSGLERKLTVGAALSVFALSALHLAGGAEGQSLILELVAHQASLPLIVCILIQDYRFAFADLFLKRSMSLVFLAGTVFVAYSIVVAPVWSSVETFPPSDPLPVGILLLTWIASALAYPAMHRASEKIVDRVILGRPEFDFVHSSLAKSLENIESETDVLRTVSEKVSGALMAEEFNWSKSESKSMSSIDESDKTPGNFEVAIPTAEVPSYRISFEKLRTRRKLLSEERAFLSGVALTASRRIDAIRVAHLKCEQELREEVSTKLTTQAQLTALRSQINPHFLFNALSTIGYLIQTSPDSAFKTLMQLTKLLRRVLRSESEFCSLETEIDLIENYLEIEKARFEERLQVLIDIPESLRKVNVPALIVQPLVENSIKHGISENENGGAIEIKASVSDRHLIVEVNDTGCGRNTPLPESNPGIGLENIRGRLSSYFGEDAGLELIPWGKNGTSAVLKIPMQESKERA